MNTQNLLLYANNVSHITGLTVQGHQSVLKDGASVFVKIIADKGHGIYEGSVAGHKVNINSDKGLQVGSSFVASISSKNGTIYISPKDALNSLQNKSYIQFTTVEGDRLQTLLANLGVPVNQLSENILKMMMMNEMKIDTDVLRNIFINASKYKGKEKLAGELLLLLKNKGIEVYKEDVEALLAYLEKNNEDIADYLNNNSEKRDKELINKLNEKEEGWTLVPYNLVDKENEKIIGKGVLRILLSNYKALKKICLNCFYNDKEYMFALHFSSKKLNEVQFNINPCERSEEYYIDKLNLLFNKNDNDVNVEWVTPSLIEGCGSEGEKIYSFEGEA